MKRVSVLIVLSCGFISSLHASEHLIINNGVFKGDLKNNGSLSQRFQNEKAGSVTGNIINENGATVGTFFSNQGVVNGSMINNGVVSNFMVNSGTINRDMINSSLINENFFNTLIGQINGNMINNGRIINEKKNEPAIENKGSISGKVINNGFIGGDFINNGSVSGGIVNSGTIAGQAQIGDAQLLLTGSQAQVSGNITGNPLSTIIVGSNAITSQYTALSGNGASVGSLQVLKGSTLSLDDGVTWTATGSNGTVNNGLIVLNNKSAIDSAFGLTNSGSLSLGTEKQTSAVLSGDTVNGGSLILNPTDHSAGNTLTVNGNYE